MAIVIPNANNVSKPVALITGAAKRIGAEIATALHHAGFRVVIHCHTSRQAAEILGAKFNQIQPDSALVYSADLCQPNSADALIDAVIDWGGRLDVLINNASLFSKYDKDWLALFACNVRAPYCLSHAAYQHLASTQGCIINITDRHASQPLRGYAAYCQSKAALLMQTQALALEFAPLVRVNAIAPGAIVWPEGDNSLDLVTQDKIIAKALLKRHGDPKYIAQAVLYLVTNTFVTGENLKVDGGR